MVRKIRQDLEKARKHRDSLENRIPTFEKSVDELTSLVEKCSKDTDRETKRKEAAIKEKQTLQA
jgi:hypothetical protein